jgi:putative hydrolase of the HAD superfamily
MMSRLPTLSAVIFDLDDTLYLERDYVISGFHAVASWAEGELGVPLEQGLSDLRSLFDDGVRTNTFDRWLRVRGFEPQRYLRKMVDAYREHHPTISTLKPVPGLLASLADKCQLGLITDGRSPVQRRKLDALELASSFDAVVLTGDLGPNWWKPSVLPFELIIGLLGASARNVVYVADNPLKDFVGARAAGMFTIWVHTPRGLYSSLQPPSRAYLPDMAIDELSALEGVLAEATFALRRPP